WAAIAASRRAEISASRASACASARTSARRARWPSISPRTLASCVSIFAAGGSALSVRCASSRPAVASSRFAVSRAAASRSAERRAALRLPPPPAPAPFSRAPPPPRRPPRPPPPPPPPPPRAGAPRPRLLLGLHIAPHGLELGLDLSEAVLAGQTARRAGRRIGGDREAVPAPEVALARYQALAGLKRRHEACGMFALDHSDLRQPS